IDAALARNPENSITHANQGWALLEQGDPKKALEHFREALRLDPESEWARQGIIEALKARHFLYAWMLRYFLWMSRLSTRTQWMIILGGYFGSRLLAGMADKNPDIAPWILPIRILYFAFVILTWTADPLFNLILRLNRFGRLVLTREQVVASNWVGGCILLALVSLASFILGGPPYSLMAALIFGCLIMPLAGTFSCSIGWPRKVMTAYTGGMALLGLAALLLLMTDGSPTVTGKANHSGALGLLSLFFLGAIGSGFIANILISQRPKR
ncbi:MAG TPA: tetratricopeptide repeat protein, partial [Clostridia bacterium]|nr:tetratricopeptide repeat protein [Clostridia bacterium]